MAEETKKGEREIKITTSGQYIKDFSFENLLAPQIFTEKSFTPEIKVSIDLKSQALQKDFFEVSLSISSVANFKEKKVFILELIYSGIFKIEDYASEEELKEVLFIYCPSLLFPYARRLISDTTRDASMPPLLLDAINFKALYDSKRHEIIKTTPNE
jgi:preprotein translocase subunit SecB